MSSVPPITCEISEPGRGERRYCVPLWRNARASLLKEKASFGQEFGGISRSVGGTFSGWGWEAEGLLKAGQEKNRLFHTGSISL